MSQQEQGALATRRLIDGSLLAVLGVLAFWFTLSTLEQFNYNWDWPKAWSWISKPNENYGGLSFFASTILNSLKITGCVVIFATILGFIGGLARTSSIHIFRVLSSTYVGIVRNLPPLVSIFILHFFVTGQLIPLFPLEPFTNWLGEGVLRRLIFADPAVLENMISGIIALSIIEGAFITEIVRGGMKGIPQGQAEAGRSLGLSSLQTLRHILIPQLLKIIRLPLGNSVVSILKNTAILSLISVQDLTFGAQDIANSGGPIFEIWIITAGIYLILCVSIDQALKRVLR